MSRCPRSHATRDSRRLIIKAGSHAAPRSRVELFFHSTESVSPMIFDSAYGRASRFDLLRKPGHTFLTQLDGKIHGPYGLRYVLSGSAFCVSAPYLQTTLWGPIRTPYPHSVSVSVFWVQLRIPYPHSVSVSVFWGQLRIPYPYFGAGSVFRIYGLGQVPYSVFRIRIPYLRFGTGSA